MTTTPQAALLSEADMLDCLREATHEIPTRIPPGWRKVMQAAEKRILAKLQDGRNTPFGREAEKLADNYLDLQAQYADAVAKLQATQEPVHAGELPPPPTLSDDERQWLHYNPNTSDIEEWVYGYAVAYARAALSARKPLPYDLICNAIDLADTESMKGDYMLDSSDCIAVVRTMQALIEINGIGLEVKP